MRIILASILKPVDDTRIYEKLAQSIAETNKYEINIIGFQSKVGSSHPLIHFHPLFDLHRLGLKRLTAPISFLKKLMELRPGLLIICTYELLLAASFYKIFYGGKIVYDVQEDYKRNIISNSSLPMWVKYPISQLVRVIEQCNRPWVDHYLLAEKVYRKLPFVKQKYTIIENKCKPIADRFRRKPRREKLRFIYSGTIAAAFGIFDALALFEKIYEQQPNIEFEIIGYAADKKELKILQDRILGKPDIRLIGGSELVPHKTIMHHLARADFGLVAYKKTPNIVSRFPTKIFEYLALGLPMILQNHDPWVTYCQESDAAVVIDYQNFDVMSIWQQINHKKFYPNGPPGKALWSLEGEQLQELVAHLLA